MTRPILALCFLPFLVLGFILPSEHNVQLDIESVLADPAFNKVVPVNQTDWSEYHQQVTDRLEYLEELLRSRDVTSWSEALQVERGRNLDRLHTYRLAGRFPVNSDHPEMQLPCFYDRDGNFCAVANLIARSGRMDLVNQINVRYQYATVSRMNMEELDQWIATSGLTREEVITIQEPAGILTEGGGFSIRTALNDTTTSSQKVDSTALHGVDSLPALSMWGSR